MSCARPERLPQLQVRGLGRGLLCQRLSTQTRQGKDVLAHLLVAMQVLWYDEREDGVRLCVNPRRGEDLRIRAGRTAAVLVGEDVDSLRS